MEGRGDDRFFTMREAAFTAVLLTVYGLLIFFSPDPTWVVWAGSMMTGALDVSLAPPAGTGETLAGLRTAGGLSAIGILAAMLLGAGIGAAANCERSHRGGIRQRLT